MYPPGLRLRQVREKLGLTYRNVERASFDIAVKRGRPDFIVHISRLADIENRNVVPSLHKLYSLAAIYHLDPAEISAWYEAPLPEAVRDGAAIPPPLTQLALVEGSPVLPPALDEPRTQEHTGLLLRPPDSVHGLPIPMGKKASRYRYGFVGLSDRRMIPILRPGSIVLVDTSLRRVDNTNWTSEYDRPIYFVEIREGYRCGWFQLEGSRLIMQPHTLSRCMSETWQMPQDAELVGQVIGVSTYLNAPWLDLPSAGLPGRANWNSTAP